MEYAHRRRLHIEIYGLWKVQAEICLRAALSFCLKVCQFLMKTKKVKDYF